MIAEYSIISDLLLLYLLFQRDHVTGIQYTKETEAIRLFELSGLLTVHYPV